MPHISCGSGGQQLGGKPVSLWLGEISPLPRPSTWAVGTAPAHSIQQANPHKGQALAGVTALWSVQLLPPGNPIAAAQLGRGQSVGSRTGRTLKPSRVDCLGSLVSSHPVVFPRGSSSAQDSPQKPGTRQGQPASFWPALSVLPLLLLTTQAPTAGTLLLPLPWAGKHCSQDCPLSHLPPRALAAPCPCP
jgi:hypothetical protein